LRVLYLDSSPVSDAGLAHFAASKDLETLWVSGTKIGDEGLNRIKEFKNLTDLNLFTTKVSSAKVTELSKALPQCRIARETGTIEPKK
jgi:hypothetical protein